MAQIFMIQQGEQGKFVGFLVGRGSEGNIKLYWVSGTYDYPANAVILDRQRLQFITSNGPNQRQILIRGDDQEQEKENEFIHAARTFIGGLFILPENTGEQALFLPPRNSEYTGPTRVYTIARYLGEITENADDVLSRNSRWELDKQAQDRNSKWAAEQKAPTKRAASENAEAIQKFKILIENVIRGLESFPTNDSMKTKAGDLRKSLSNISEKMPVLEAFQEIEPHLRNWKVEGINHFFSSLTPPKIQAKLLEEFPELTAGMRSEFQP